MEDYTAATSGNGVQKTIFLETAAATEDLDKEDAYILDLCANPTTLVSAAVFGCDMEAPDFKERVTRLAASEYVKGIRQVFYVRPPLPPPRSFHRPLRDDGWCAGGRGAGLLDQRRLHRWRPLHR